ncbi:hypothetical protein FHR81_002014 [Actinoalloteichus hoggarensis]|uniref:Uncharacterized protein n=1 Tax=Actinoalloteichus hoggarensis TaxID=1470176 RepID=A0A221W596_9PSEU|nr:hypothetical protein [Actinoalloteichus hoggarensis]ASO21045.1 hypothetical protein AHOG_17095 [Actinoalloteichus hoggarensis]MBB5920976.1 hypothetical protein [Actinoalloteichus hoggarensis]
MRPAWVGADGLTPRGHAGRWVPAVIAVLCAGIGALALAVTPSAFPTMVSWQVGLVALHALCLAGSAALWVALCLRLRWIVERGRGTSLVLALPFVSMFGVAIYVLGGDAVWEAGYQRGIETWAVSLHIASVVAALVTYALFFVYIMRADRLFNSGIAVPGEEVAEAMRSHDPARAHDLYARTGYRIGILQGS